MRKLSPLVSIVGTSILVVIAAISAQQTPPEGRGRGQGRGPGGPAQLALDDRTGFDAIFDGTSLNNWEGDPAFWKVAEGAIVGESTATTPLNENTFVVWRGGEPGDFELKVELRMNAGNSGIQVRSTHLPPGTKSGRGEVAGKWVLKGYQADFDSENVFTGMWYEERARGFLARRGEATYVPATGGPKVIGRLERNADELKNIVKRGDWNHVHVIARGNTLINIVNGNVTAIVVDDDTANRSAKGLLGFQLHTGPPMKVEFRNVYLKKL